MKLEVTGRHVDVTPALKTFTREKISKLQRWIDDPLQVHAILTVEKHRHIAEIVARTKNFSCSAREVTPDMYTSIGKCADKIERQARKHKEKFEERRRRSAKETVETAPAEPAAAKRASPRRARRPAAGMDGVPQIVKADVFPRKPMSVEEAALQIREYGLNFFVFRNERSQEINVLYLLGDGRLGLIEPER